MNSRIIHFSEGDARQQLTARAHARGLEWLAGAIGEVTFLRSLMLYGYSLESAKHELHKLQCEP